MTTATATKPAGPTSPDAARLRASLQIDELEASGNRPALEALAAAYQRRAASALAYAVVLDAGQHLLTARATYERLVGDVDPDAEIEALAEFDPSVYTAAAIASSADRLRQAAGGLQRLSRDASQAALTVV